MTRLSYLKEVCKFDLSVDSMESRPRCVRSDMVTVHVLFMVEGDAVNQRANAELMVERSVAKGIVLSLGIQSAWSGRACMRDSHWIALLFHSFRHP